MSGKRRKKRLQNKQHKFFTGAEPSANVMETETTTEKEIPKVDPNTTKLVGVKLIQNRSYYLVQKGSSMPEYQPVTMAHWHARSFITQLIRVYQNVVEEDKINFIRHRTSGGPFPPQPEPLRTVMSDTVEEVSTKQVNGWEFLLTYRCQELPPEWVTLDRLPPGALSSLIEKLKGDYYIAIGKPLRY